MAAEDVGEEPDRWRLGPDRSGNLIELVVLLTAEGTELVIHDMPLRARRGKRGRPRYAG